MVAIFIIAAFVFVFSSSAAFLTKVHLHRLLSLCGSAQSGCWNQSQCISEVFPAVRRSGAQSTARDHHLDIETLT